MIQNTRRFLTAHLLTETFFEMPDDLQNTRIVTSAAQSMQLHDLLRSNRTSNKSLNKTKSEDQYEVVDNYLKNITTVYCSDIFLVAFSIFLNINHN
jgi:hypothetical protein